MCTQVSKLRTVLGTVPDAFVCPITQEIMKEPTMAADGFSYERVYIAQWLSTANTSPKTGAVLPHVLAWCKAQAWPARVVNPGPGLDVLAQ